MYTEDLESLSRREREKVLRKQEMIGAARLIFARKGYAQTKLEDVAELAEFGKGTLYNYFPNKAALFVSVLEATFYGFQTIFEETLNSELEFSEKISQTIERSLRYAFSNPEGIMLMARESHHLQENNPLMQLHPHLVGQLADTIAVEQQRNPKLLQSDPRALAMILMNLVMGQFMSRAQLCYQDVREREIKGEERREDLMDEVFGQFRREDVEQIVGCTTELIHTLFFYGIYNGSKSSKRKS